MDKNEQVIHKRITMALASLTALEHLVVALFDAIPDKRRVIDQFTDTTERTNVEFLYSTMPEGFAAEFELQRKVLLAQISDASTAP